MAGVTYREALRRALDEELARDERVFLMGEEIGRFEGSYKVTAGPLRRSTARERVRETPIAEEGFVGAGVGAAMLGLRPVVEIMTINFILVAMDMVVNHAAKVRQMFGGKVGVPAGDPHARRRRRAADRAALAEPRGDVRAHARPQGRRARRRRATPTGCSRRAIRDDDPCSSSRTSCSTTSTARCPSRATTSPCRSAARRSCARAATSRSSRTATPCAAR